MTVPDWISRGTRLQVNIYSYKCIKHISRELLHNYFTSAGKTKSQIIKQSKFIWVWDNSSALLGKGKNPVKPETDEKLQNKPKPSKAGRYQELLCSTRGTQTAHTSPGLQIHPEWQREEWQRECSVCTEMCYLIKYATDATFKSFPSTSGPKVD